MPAVAGYDPNPSDNVRVEVAFTTTPDSASPAFRDLTSRLDLASTVSITRGRTDEFSVIQPSSCSLTLDNNDGALTAGNASSAFYPNVKPQRRIRVTYRNDGVIGNFVDAASATLETGIGGWVSAGAASVARDNTRATDGSWSLKITWAVTASTSKATVPVTGLTIGRSYRLFADSFVPTGGEPVSLNIDGIGLGVTSATTNAWERLSTTFTATATSHSINVYQFSVGTGYSSWVDSIRIDEATCTDLTTFTTQAPPIVYRFDGHVEEWPVEWPNGGKYAQAQITAVDRLARVGNKRPMRSIIEEAILFKDPAAYYPLGEPELSTKAGEITGSVGTSPLSVTQAGAGGTLEFGTATGPPTDALPAPTFTPTSSANGKYLSGSMPVVGGVNSVSVRANFLTSTVAEAAVVRLVDPYGSYLNLGIDSTGHLEAYVLGAFRSGVKSFTVASSAMVTDGLTHDACVTLSLSGGTVSVTLYLDGASVGTTSYSASLLYAFSRVRIGGDAAVLFNGVIAHVAAFNVALSAGDVGTIATSTTTGFAGESSDARISRYADWAGIPAGDRVLDVGASDSIAFTDTTGQSVLQAMQDVAATENGRLFVDGRGRVVFHARSRSYDNAAAVASLDANLLGENARFSISTQGLVNDATAQRPDGPAVRAFDQSSIDEYGVSAQSMTTLVTDDAEVADAVNWRVFTNSVPKVRIPQTDLDAYTDSTGYQAQIRALELGDRLTITGLPSTAPASTVDLIVEGYTETIGLTGWTVSANTSNYSEIVGWVWDTSHWDDGSRWIY